MPFLCLQLYFADDRALAVGAHYQPQRRQHQREQGQGHWQAHLQPGDKIEVQGARGNGIGRTADDGGEPTDIGGVGSTEHDKGAGTRVFIVHQ